MYKHSDFRSTSGHKKTLKNKSQDRVIIRDKSDTIDTVIRLIAFGSITGTMLVAPNALQLLEKPLNFLLDGLDEREKRRKLSRLKSYLKTQGLVRYDYDHGLKLTKKAMKRLEKIEFNNIAIPTPDIWDRKWRMIMFDVPETDRYAREKLIDKFKELGMQLLQQSVWIHPYPCRDELSNVAIHLGIQEWLTYIETSHIDNEEKLIYRFRQTSVI